MNKERELKLCKEILDAPNDKYAMELIEFYGEEKYQEGLKQRRWYGIGQSEYEGISDIILDSYKKELIEKIENYKTEYDVLGRKIEDALVNESFLKREIIKLISN